VLLAVREATGSEWECVPGVAAGMGGGLGRQGEACGALTGGVLALGLLYGENGPATPEAKEALYRKVQRFADRFAASNGGLRCHDLLGVDLRSDDGRAEFDARHLGDQRCVPAVRSATQTLIALIAEWASARP
jgi:C_GCAxxG_C_C family probable redox protein